MPIDQPEYPVNLLVAGKPALVVGGGRVALGKVRGLLEAGADVRVVATRVSAEIKELPVTWDERPYADGDASGHRLVVAATDDPVTNRKVFVDAEAAGVFINSADDPANCTFTLPARVRQGSLLVTVSTGGRSPAVAAWLRRRLADQLGPEFSALVDLAAAHREALHAQGVATEQLDWQRALDSGMLELIRAGRLDEAKERLQACLSSSSD